MNDKLYEYKGSVYPYYLKNGNAMQHIQQTAALFCEGRGLDIGASRWPFPGSVPIYDENGLNAYNLPDGEWDYIFSSHCLEHLTNPVNALVYWQSKIKPGGCLFLYLPHPDMEYWLPQNNRKHLHQWHPEDMHKLLVDLGYENVLSSQRDMNWSFSCVGWVSGNKNRPAGTEDAWTR